MISNRYEFQIVALSHTSSLFEVPAVAISKFLILAKPICPLVFSVPGVAVTASKSFTIPYGFCASVPASLPNSGRPCEFITFTKLPSLTGVDAPVRLAVLLAFLIGIVEPTGLSTW